VATGMTNEEELPKQGGISVWDLVVANVEHQQTLVTKYEKFE
jgi:hypothetical protein